MSTSRFTDFSHIVESLAKIPHDSGFSYEALTAHFAAELKGSKQSVRDTYQACLGRLAEPPFATEKYRSSKAAAKHIAATLFCPEFLSKIPQLMLQAFPQAPRAFFIHIPKTGGSDVIQRFQSGGCFSWRTSYTAMDWLSEIGGLSVIIRDMADQMINKDRRFLYSGHFPVSDFFFQKLCRSHDKVFSIVRNPQDMIVSALNYYLMSMIDCPDRPDGKLWRSWLQGRGIDPPSTNDDVTPEMIECLFFHPNFAIDCENLILRHLSSDGTISSMLYNINTFNIHVVHSDVTDDYLLREFGLKPSDARENVSRKFVNSFDDLPKKWRLHARSAMIFQDLGIYSLLTDLMGRDGVLKPLRDLESRFWEDPLRL